MLNFGFTWIVVNFAHAIGAQISLLLQQRLSQNSFNVRRHVVEMSVRILLFEFLKFLWRSVLFNVNHCNPQILSRSSVICAPTTSESVSPSCSLNSSKIC